MYALGFCHVNVIANKCVNNKISGIYAAIWVLNIINTSDKYKGVYSCYTESEIFETIIIYPIITDTELRRKLNIPENF